MAARWKTDRLTGPDLTAASTAPASPATSSYPSSWAAATAPAASATSFSSIWAAAAAHPAPAATALKLRRFKGQTDNTRLKTEYAFRKIEAIQSKHDLSKLKLQKR